MFRTLLFVGRLIQFIGALIPLGGVVFGALLISSPYTQGSALGVVLAGITGGLFLYAFGGLVCVNVMAYRNSQRIAGALNRIARAQTGVAEFVPTPPRKG